MQWQASPYTIPLFVVSAVSLAAAIFNWRRQKTLSGVALSLLTLSLAVWSAGYALQLAAADEPTKVIWRNVKNIGVVPVATLWLIAVLQYTGYRRWLTRRIVLLLAIEPTAGLLISWTNDWHHFFEKGVTLVPSGSILVRVVDYGWWFWFNAAYAYILFISCAILLIHTFLRARRLYRQQILILFLFAATPWVGNAIYVSKLIFNWGTGPIPDITPFLFVIAALILLWGTLRYQLMDVVPIARDIIVNNMDNGVLVLDTRGVVVDLNPMVEKILGYTEAELVGTPVFPRLWQWPQLAEKLKNAEAYAGEQSLYFSDDTHYFEWHLNELIENPNISIGWVVIFRDITHHKKSETELRVTNQQLQKEISLREELIEELDAFAHTVAHDLKNPLSIILGYIDVLHLELVEQEQDASLVNYAKKVERAAQKMGHIVDALLLLANLRQETMTMTPLSTSYLISEVEQRLAVLIASRHAEIIKPKQWHTAIGYAPWVEEVWENLISNAIKYGGNPARVEVGSGIDTDGMVRFWVKDNGNGMSPEACEKVFDEVYMRTHKSSRGNGIGLSIVRRIVERLGGTVRAQPGDEPDVGCIFSFTLPADTTDVSVPQIEKSMV